MKNYFIHTHEHLTQLINARFFYYSSRFTDSKKYETDFIQCFQLETPRRGEICNACVLLVKRFKRLPPGSNRHWGHVVDARTGPGLKSMTKFKKRKEEQDSVKETNERFKFKKSKKKVFKKETSSLGGSSDDSPPSPTESQHSDDYDDRIFTKKFITYSTRAQNSKKRQEAALRLKRRRKNPHPIKITWKPNHFNLFSDVVSNELWQQKSTCCGAVYESEDFNAVIINVASFRPCKQHQSMQAQSRNAEVSIQQQSSTLPPLKVTSDNSSPQQHTTAIKKHQLFLKRHIPDSSVGMLCDKTSSSNVTDKSSNNDIKTDIMDVSLIESKSGKLIEKNGN
jgi:hypothetical protein